MLFQHRAKPQNLNNNKNAAQKYAIEVMNAVQKKFNPQHQQDTDDKVGHVTETVIETVTAIGIETVVETLSMMMFGVAPGSTIATAMNGTMSKRLNGSAGELQIGNLEFSKDRVLI